MSKQPHGGESADSALGVNLVELSSTLPIELQVKRGRPSRKKIEMMIAAPKSPIVRIGAETGPLVQDPNPKVETLLGTGNLLNPDIQIEFTESVENSNFSGHYLSKLFHFIDQIPEKPFAYHGLVSREALTTLGVAQQALKSFVRKKHGYAIYFCNLDIESESLCINQWRYQIAVNAEFEPFANSFLEAAGLGSELLDYVLPSSSLASFALLIGTPQFWTELKTFLEHILMTALKSTRSEEMLEGLDAHGMALAQCLMVEFIRRSNHLKSFKFKSTQLERKLDGFMLEMRTMKDLACKSKSIWLLNCWSNYSMLYQTSQSSLKTADLASLHKITHARFFN